MSPNQKRGCAVAAASCIAVLMVWCGAAAWQIVDDQSVVKTRDIVRERLGSTLDSAMLWVGFVLDWTGFLSRQKFKRNNK